MLANCVSYRLRRRLNLRRLLVYGTLVLGFLASWCLLTILILIAQDKLLGPLDEDERHSPSRSASSNRGVQIVVGHYNGNLPAEKLANLTEGSRTATLNVTRRVQLQPRSTRTTTSRSSTLARTVALCACRFVRSSSRRRLLVSTNLTCVSLPVSLGARLWAARVTYRADIRNKLPLLRGCASGSTT